MRKLSLKLKYKNLVFLGVLVITLIGGLISRANIIGSTTFWYDESFSGMLMKENFIGLFKIIVKDKVHPPIYYTVLKIWSLLFGNTDTSLRALSLVLGIALVIIAAYLVYKTFGKKAALISSILFSLSPFFILYSVEARSYIMLALESLIYVIYSIRVLKKDIKSFKVLFKDKDFRIFFLLSLILIFTHFLSVLLMVPIGILFLYNINKTLGKAILSGLIFIGFVLISNGILTDNYRVVPEEYTHTHWLSDPVPWDMGEMFYSFLFGVDSQSLGDPQSFKFENIDKNEFNYDLIYGTLLILITVPAIYSSLKSKDENFKLLSRLFIVSTLFVLVVSLFGVNFFLPRYLMVLAVLFIIWLSVLLSQFRFNTGFVLIGLYLLLLTQVKWFDSNRNYDEITQRVMGTNQRVVFESPFDFLTTKYYVNGRKKIYFLDGVRTKMYEGTWGYFEKDELVYELKPDDYYVED